MAISKGAKKILEWLKSQRAGAVVPYQEVMDVTGWTEVSLNTYLTKRKLAPFLQKLQDRKLKVLMDGSDVSEAFFDETFTQTGPKNVSVSAGDVLTRKLGQYEFFEPLVSAAVAPLCPPKSKSYG